MVLYNVCVPFVGLKNNTEYTHHIGFGSASFKQYPIRQRMAVSEQCIPTLTFLKMIKIADGGW